MSATSTCPSCAGPLDPIAGDTARCPSCRTQLLLDGDSWRPVICGTLPERFSRVELLPRLHELLRARGFEAIPEMEVRPAPARYLMRRGRVRTRATSSPERVREGLFGIPCAGPPHSVYFLADSDPVHPVDDELPGELPSKILVLEDDVEAALAREHLSRGLLKNDKVLQAVWTDDLYVLTLPIDTWSFTPELRETWLYQWHFTRPDGVYSVAIDRFTGETVQAQLPLRGVRTTLAVGLFFLGLLGFLSCVLLPTLLAVVILAVSNP